MLRQLTVLMCGLLVVVVFAMGCGDSGDDGTTTAAGSRATDKSPESQNAGSAVSGEDAPSDIGAPTASKVPVKTSSLGKHAFIRRASAICTATNKQMEVEFAAYGERTGGATKGAQFARAVSEIAYPTLSRQVKQIQALGAPEGDEGAIEKFLTATQQAVSNGTRDPARSIQELLRQFEAANDLAAGYTLETCALK